MPQIDIKYSNKMDLNFHDLFTKIEQTINKTDSKAGLCKCRAIPIENYLHDHILINISLIQYNKPGTTKNKKKNYNNWWLVLIKPNGIFNILHYLYYFIIVFC